MSIDCDAYDIYCTYRVTNDYMNYETCNGRDYHLEVKLFASSSNDFLLLFLRNRTVRVNTDHEYRYDDVTTGIYEDQAE